MPHYNQGVITKNPNMEAYLDSIIARAGEHKTGRAKKEAGGKYKLLRSLLRVWG